MTRLFSIIISSFLLLQFKANAQKWENDMDGESYCENTTVGTYLYTLEALGATVYYIENEDNVPFGICSSTSSTAGDVCLTEKLNRESSSKYDVRFCAIESSNPAVCITSVVSVDDENDNAPQFQGLPYINDILEGTTTIGIPFMTAVANDADDGFAAAVEFELQGLEKDNFDLKPDSTVIDGKYSTDISLNIDLDFETSQIHVVTLIGKDKGDIEGCGAKKIRNSTTTIYVNVQNGPDMPPVFTSTEYTAKMEENTKILFDFVNITAKDGDYGLDWKIVYSLHGGDSIFDIDTTSGEIIVNKEVDRESEEAQNGQFLLTVTATEVVPGDAAANFPGFDLTPMSTNTSLIITVVDANDNEPLFYDSDEYITTATSYNTSVQENSLNDIPDFFIYVKDKDQGDNAKFDLALKGVGAEYFELSTTEVTSQAIVSLRIVDNTGLDYESVKSLNFEIVANESGKPDTIADITVMLEDVNDNYPVFDQSEYEASIPEHSTIGTDVITIKATDEDSGENGEFIFTLLSSTEFFDITEDGIVRVKSDLNREERSEYYLTVRAEDSGGLVNTTQLTVTITDINDQDPVFQQNQYTANWIENSDDAAPVSIYVLDLDEPDTENSNLTLEFADEHSKLNYSISETSAGGGGTTFEVRPSHPLNAEEAEGSCSNGVIEYSLGVVVYDNGVPQRNDTATITIFLEDANDFTPVFEQLEYSGSVAEAAAIGTEIANVSATDGDVCNPNNDITYTVDDDNTDKFSIITLEDGSRGILQIKSDRLDRDEQGTYDIIVKAIDNGNPRNTGTATVKVTITDINNKNPVFNASTSQDTISVQENADIDTVVTTLVANDNDIDSELEYSIIGATCEDENENKVSDDECKDWFQITTIDQKGDITVAKRLDRETVEKVTLSVQVEDTNADKNYPDQTDSWTIEIDILDYNDNSPVFNEIPALSVIEEVVIGTVIQQVSATDEDKDQTITFTMDNNFVEVTSEGQLKVKNRIDREGNPGDMFTAVISATDNGKPSLTSNITVNFTVIDTNDNTPGFQNNRTSFNCSVEEELEAGTEVCLIEATDIDFGPNAEISYSIQPGDAFSIDSSTGQISTRVVLDREMNEEYQLKFKAKDNAGSQSRETEVDLVITVIDTDDNAPSYEDVASQTMSVDEEKDKETSVGFVTDSKDADTEKFQNNYFFLVYKNNTEEGVFRLDKSTRELYTLGALDRESKDSYELFVLTTRESTISDTSYSSYDKSSILTVSIVVRDINDNPPTFSMDKYSTDIQFDTQPSDTNAIVVVSATDKDIDVNSELTYTISSQIYSGESGNNNNIFSIEKVNENANIYLVGALSPTIGESYTLTLEVADGGTPSLSSNAEVIIRIHDAIDESVVMGSTYSPEYLNEHRSELEKDLENSLDADVVIDSILEHVSGTPAPAPEARAESLSQSDITFHATEWNETTLVPAAEITTTLTNDENIDILIEWAVVSVQSQNTEVETPVSETDFLRIVLIVVCCLFAIILVVFTAAFIIMRRRYQTKIKAHVAHIKVDKAQANAGSGGGRGLNIPNTNQAAAGKSKLFEEYEKGNVDMNLWRESNDDDSSIDDNAVDSQDSAISTDPRDQEGLNAEYDELNDIDIDFDESNDAKNLAAALNAAKRNNGEEDLLFSFDNPAMENTTM